MMDHAHYRTAIMADPHNADAELRAHREACAECRAFTERLLKFESRLERAMRVTIPSKGDVLPFARKRGNAPAAPRRWMALAASVLDELQIHLIPVLLGQGHLQFEDMPPDRIELELLRAQDGIGVLHLRYRVRPEG